jgi:hypothetical protein
MNRVQSVIYAPPKSELPFLVVTVAPWGISAMQVRSRTEARKIAGRVARQATVHARVTEAPPEMRPILRPPSPG